MKLVAFIIAVSGIVQTSPPSFFGNDYDAAIQRMQADHGIITGVAHEKGVNERLLCAMVFPEYIRYSYLSGLIETTSLELLYVQSGSRIVDFSIGNFQMKPSFAETVEKKVRSLSLDKKYGELLTPDPAGRAGRQERLSRLSDTRGQVLYACAFIEICTKQFGLSGMYDEEKLRYLSTIYNRGMHLGRTEIEEAMSVRSFPHGAKYSGSQFAYWEVSMDYYLKYPAQ